jgi:alkaline phosphatase D
MFSKSFLRSAVKSEGHVSRRLFLHCLSSVGVLAWGVPGASPAPTAWANPRPRFQQDPFTLGVASGDPDSRSVVLWTRLAPQPLEADGGLPAESLEVRWEIAHDDSFKDLVARGVALARPQLAHAVHIEVDGLEPDRWYWYRFHAGDATSPVGRTRTMPAPHVLPGRLSFAFASCQNYEQGLYTAYEQMATEELDLVFHLGDYIYEGAGRPGKTRQHAGPEIESLGDYRIRHAQYRSDPLLHAMHARCPWLVTWDDHELDNNYADSVSEQDGVDPVEFLYRRINAYQAYYEAMPLRKTSMPRGADMQLYRRADFGRLANLLVLDTRQYRTDQPNGDQRTPLNEAALAAQNTILGRQQKQWVYQNLVESHATWNVLAQQVMMGMVTMSQKGDPDSYVMDQWPGYARERMELIRFMQERRIANPIVLTGDIHSNWVNDLRVDDRQPETPVVATEFVGTSISSGGNGEAKPAWHDLLVANNPLLKFVNFERGYVKCTVTPQAWQSDYMVVSDVTQPGGQVSCRASFLVENGSPGAALITENPA